MYKISRIKANESGNLNNNGSIVNIDVNQSYGNVDFSRSYVLFYIDIQPSNTTTIHNFCLQNNDGYLPSSAIVKQYRKQFDQKGKVVDVNNLDLYNCSMAHYLLDSEEKRALLHPLSNPDGTAGEYFLRKQTIGTTYSSYETYPLKVMLKDLDDFNNVAQNISLMDYGNCRETFELNKNVFTVSDIPMINNIVQPQEKTLPNIVVPGAGPGTTPYFGVGHTLLEIPIATWNDPTFRNREINIGDKLLFRTTTTVLAQRAVEIADITPDTADPPLFVSITFTADIALTDGSTYTPHIQLLNTVFDQYVNSSGGNVDLQELIYTPFVDFNEIPFYVGMNLTIVGINNLTPVNVDRDVTQIIFNSATRKVTLGFGAAIATVANGQTFTPTSVFQKPYTTLHAGATVQTNLSDVELVLYTRSDQPVTEKLEYKQLLSIPFNLSGTSHEQSFYLHPDCINVYVMRPSSDTLPVAADKSLLS